MSEILLDVAALLDGEVVAALDDPLRHHVRVAANLCRIVEREVRLAPGADEREHELLRSLLDADGSIPELHDTLATRIREGVDDDAFRRAAWPVLAEITAAKLAVAKPDHTAYDMAAER